jgi:hypothetical protein
MHLFGIMFLKSVFQRFQEKCECRAAFPGVKYLATAVSMRVQLSHARSRHGFFQPSLIFCRMHLFGIVFLKSVCQRFQEKCECRERAFGRVPVHIIIVCLRKPNMRPYLPNNGVSTEAKYAPLFAKCARVPRACVRESSRAQHNNRSSR